MTLQLFLSFISSSSPRSAVNISGGGQSVSQLQLATILENLYRTTVGSYGLAIAAIFRWGFEGNPT